MGIIFSSAQPASSSQKQAPVIPSTQSKPSQIINQVQEKVSEMVNSLAQKRIRNQLKDIKDNRPPNWHVIPSLTKWNQWTVELRADNSCPFHSKTIEISVVFPPDYPKTKPDITMKRPEIFFHPNISEKGEICVDSVKLVDSSLRLRDRIEGVSFILSHPNERDAYNFSAVTLFLKSKKEYYIKASMVFRERQKKPHPDTNFLKQNQ